MKSAETHPFTYCPVRVRVLPAGTTKRISDWAFVSAWRLRLTVAVAGPFNLGKGVGGVVGSAVGEGTTLGADVGTAVAAVVGAGSSDPTGERAASVAAGCVGSSTAGAVVSLAMMRLAAGTQPAVPLLATATG
jgi:hypothetical protein